MCEKDVIITHQMPACWKQQISILCESWAVYVCVLMCVWVCSTVNRKHIHLYLLKNTRKSLFLERCERLQVSCAQPSITKKSSPCQTDRLLVIYAQCQSWKQPSCCEVEQRSTLQLPKSEEFWRTPSLKKCFFHMLISSKMSDLDCIDLCLCKVCLRERGLAIHLVCFLFKHRNMWLYIVLDFGYCYIAVLVLSSPVLKAALQ